MSKKILWLIPMMLLVALFSIGKLVSAEVVSSLPTAQEGSTTTVKTPSLGVASSTDFFWPSEVRFVSYKMEQKHGGIDITTDSKGKNAEGKSVFAAHSGIVTFAAFSKAGYGNLVIIKGEDGFETYYAHLSEMEVKVGVRVEAGQIIGKIGHTGHATGSHLHFEIRKDKKLLDPLLYLSQGRIELPTHNAVEQEASSTDFIWPSTASVFVRGLGFNHMGIDIATNNASAFGRPAFAAKAGVVTFAGWGEKMQAGTGNLVIIDHGDGYETRYAHLSQIFVSVGQQVEQGQTIATIGSTGRSAGPHLHFEMRYNQKILNPLGYVKPPTSDPVK